MAVIVTMDRRWITVAPTPPRHQRRARVLVPLMFPALTACSLAAPTHRGATSDHFDGEHFFNRLRIEERGFFSFLKWQISKDPGPWEPIPDSTPGEPPPRRVDAGTLRVTFINHATMLIQMDGLNILTDPIYAERVGPAFGPRRARPPGIRFADLPPIDVVLISHNHYDHLDLPTLRRLAEHHRPRIFAGLGNRQLFVREQIDNAEDVDWWERVVLSRGVTLIPVPVQHWSGRGLTDRFKTLWAGYVIEGSGGRVYFAGDTGWGPHFAEARARLGPMRLAILPIGAYRPRWFMQQAHISPAEAIAAHRALGAATSVAMHFGTFPLGDDGQHEATDELRRLLDAAPAPRPRFWTLDFGEGGDVPEIDAE